MANCKYYFFLSYAHENKDQVMKMLDNVILAGLTVWTDAEEMKQGSIDENMTNGIRNSQVFVACISTKYEESENCMKEFNYAIAIKKDIIYVLFEKIKGEKERMDQLGVIGFHMMRKHFYKPKNVTEIIKGIKDLLIVSFMNFITHLIMLKLTNLTSFNFKQSLIRYYISTKIFIF
jgi:hypothetical protein